MMGMGMGVGFSAPPPWTPAARNPALWISPRTIAGAHGSAIASVTSLDANAIVLSQGNAGIRPTLNSNWTGGKPGIVCTGDCLTGTLAATLTDLTMFLVCQSGVDGGLVSLCNAEGVVNTGASFYRAAPSILCRGHSSDASVPTTAQPCILSMTVSDSGERIDCWINGAVGTPFAGVITPSSVKATLGALTPANGFGSTNCTIGDWIVIPGIESTANRRLTEAYLAAYYGIAVV